MDITSQATSLTTIANKIVEVNTRNNNSILVKAQKEYKKLGDFLNIQTPELERFPLPNNKEIEKLANLKIVNKSTSTTKSSGVGLGGLTRGVLSDKGKKVYSTTQMSKVAIKSSAPKLGKSSMKGGKFMSPGMRNLGGVASTLFAGLDFATGIAGGESVGKSAAGTTGALAGSLVGGAIGQALIPIPGVGYIVGSAAGNFIGGYGADRAYEAIASQSRLKAKQDAKLKAQRQVRTKGTKVENKDKILNKFDDVANKFEGFVKGLVGDVAGSIISGVDTKDVSLDGDANYPTSTTKNEAKGEYQDMDVSGGVDPSTVKVTSGYGMRGKRMHHGTDYGLDSGTPISVIQPGIVEYSGWAEGGAGNSIYINHPDGAKTVYFHLLDPSPLKNGQSIPAGTFIGKVGSTGRSSGPHLHFEYYPPGSTTRVDPEKYASKYFRFGGNVKAKPKDKPKTEATPSIQTGVKPGQVTSTRFGKQGSKNIINYGNATKNNIKGFIIVPGHIAGGGAPGEIAATQKIAKNIVDVLQKKYPGVPIWFWNHRNYDQTTSGFTKQMNDLKKLEDEGWEVIEIHMDASIESGEGKGRGVIVPFKGKGLNEFETRFAAQKGSYPSDYRDGLGTTKRGMSIVETGNINPQALSALNKGDQSVIDFFSSDTIQIFEQLIKEGKIGGGYRPAKSKIKPTPRPQKEISYKLSYKKTQREIKVLNRDSIHILDSGGNTPRIASQSPSQNEGSSASPSPPTSNSSHQHPSDILNTYIGSIRLA